MPSSDMIEYWLELDRRRAGRVGGIGARERHGSRSEAQAGTASDHYLAAALLFQEPFYLATNPDVPGNSVSPLLHFLTTGWQEGRQPNPYFQPLWYLEHHPEVRDSGLNPLVHYALHGDFAGNAPSPWFDTAWYRKHYGVLANELALLHYLQRRPSRRLNPLPDFDIDYYLERNPDILPSGIDPFEHFMNTGWRERRNPSRLFDVRFYSNRYLNGSPAENPFLHYLRHKHLPGVYPRQPEHETAVFREVKRFTRPGPDFEPLRPLPKTAPRKAKLLAYYLPQFHAIPENDAWWGEGFTEWTNVAKGMPRFVGHYQPRVPRDLGFYSLDAADTLPRQVALAQAAGLHGFVFYYYWFNGRRLLEKPIDRFLASPELEIDFALMWANENWTRRWDGHDDEILISQDYRARDEDALLADFARHFADRRYIRLDGRPLLMVYRPGKIPDAAETFARWRRIFAERYGENPIIIMGQGFGDFDPAVFGLDGAIEFPPHKITAGLAKLDVERELLDPDFSATVYRYEDVAAASLRQPRPDFPVIRTAVPSWDNDARQQGAGLVMAGSTPAKYEAWVAGLVSDTTWPDFFGERIVCVNAWNEWAEAAYLEPDLHFGAAYLNATGRAVTGLHNAAHCRLLLIGHDAHGHGAQEIILNIGRGLREAFGVEIEFLLLDGGILLPRYQAVGKTTVVKDAARVLDFLAEARLRGIAGAIVNTSAAAHLVKPATDRGIDCVLLVHELPRLIRERGFATAALTALRHCRSVVFPAAFVRDAVLQELDFPAGDKVVVYPQGRYKPVDYTPADAAAVRAELGVRDGEKLVLGVGFGDLRKGFDLFVQAWRQLRQMRDGIHFAWVGRVDPALSTWLDPEIAAAASTGTFHVVGFTESVARYYAAADVYALTSREDPHPSVVVEALSAGVPAVAFEGAGGIPELLRAHEIGIVVPYCDVAAMVGALEQLLQVPEISEADRAARRKVVDEKFSWTRYVSRLLELTVPGLAKVSVAVPNYNYARYLPSRLGSIFAQTHPVCEVLVLDDCSTDDSLAVVAAVQQDWKRELTILANERNSGSVFAQWRKAALHAHGEFLWIAEADDEADPQFLARLCALLADDPEIRFAFCDSRIVDSADRSLGGSYKQYYSTVEPAALAKTETYDGGEFVARFLAVKNIILNVSSVIWRREALLRALDRCSNELRDFKMAGDWRLYVEALSEPGAKVAYEAAPLNVHRRHSASVTHALDAYRHVEELARIQAIVGRDFGVDDPARRDEQERYLAEVRRQFGIAAEAEPVSAA